MSDPSSRQSRGGEYDFSRQNKSLTDSKGSPSKRSNMSPGDKASTHSSRYGGSSTHHDHPGRHSIPLAHNRHQGREDYQHTHISGRNPTGSSHQLPFHKNFDSSHSTGALNRSQYHSKTDHRGQFHSKNEFGNDGSRRKPHYGDKNSGIGSRNRDPIGSNYSNISQNPSSDYTQSEDLRIKSSESNQVNFPQGHPSHNPHLPIPNPFAHYPKSSSLNSSQPMPKPSGEKHRNYSESLNKESTHNHRDNNRRLERLPCSTAQKPHSSSFHSKFHINDLDHFNHFKQKVMLEIFYFSDEPRSLKSSLHNSAYDHEKEKNSSPNKPQFNSSTDTRSQHFTNKSTSITYKSSDEKSRHG